jgi:hypothetical protein
MKHPQVVVYETDGRLAQFLREPIRARRWALREPRQRDGCLRLLRGGEPTVLVLKVGNRIEKELALLERACALRPQTRSVVVGELANGLLADLAWELGASYVLFPPLPREWLPEIVVQLMQSAIAGQQSTVAALPDGTANKATLEGSALPDE